MSTLSGEEVFVPSGGVEGEAVWLSKFALVNMPARQRGLDGMLKPFPACRALPLRQLAEFSQRPFDRPDLA